MIIRNETRNLRLISYLNEKQILRLHLVQVTDDRNGLNYLFILDLIGMKGLPKKTDAASSVNGLSYRL
ncbi:hypothetical protein [Algoriphagus winogradskyi]|uniref:Uncharacterized protein n=1 Tax=Algoriphagus winogradskyi TaxID=237017 RepID=A0ABY1PF37_9BACT|nr:hypothetical protein [Algoriphagus winogradskyi]SMP32428.1 hypothetical protein SAMN06265367_10816 [Algoriphagus winogradskyi]